MDPGRWKTVNDVLLRALELAAEERDAYLDEACGGDAELRREVESLLAANPEALDGLDQPAFEVLGADRDASVGERVGPYRILSELGRGGMGVVYLAARDDGELERRVVVKVLKRGMDTEQIVHRFRVGRQILANLEHPNVAELYEGGTTGDGRPYFVMEHVEGQPIDRYCDEHALTVRERLALFCKVCDAVDFAHRNLVVHRDLKPSNILVTAAGEPKLLDFGIAKLLDPATFQALTVTEPGWRMMTPEYASPEQVRGEPVTTASDVYALGVLLYELLTGHRPYRLRSRLEEEVRRVICETEPEKPSTVVTRPEVIETAAGETVTVEPEAVSRPRGGGPRRVRRQLAGDLDNIVLMALRKEPERRYGSANALAGDLGRYLRGLPVRARKDTFLYRAGKLARRRRRELAAAAVLAAVAAGFAADHAAQVRRTEHERDKAERVSRFVIDLFEVADPFEAQGRSVTVREVLDRGARQIEQDPGLAPGIRAEMMRTIGEIYLKLGLYPEADPLLEGSLEVRRREHGAEHPDVAESLASLADLRYQQGELAVAEELYDEALAARRRQLGPEHPEVGSMLNALALVVQGRGDYERAEALHREALAIQRRCLEPDHPDLARTLNDLALVLLLEDDLDASEELFRDALDIERRRFGPRHPRVEAVLSNLASVLMTKGDYSAAEPAFREALAIAREVYGDGHPSVARISNNLAAVVRAGGDLEGAEALYREALDVAVRAFGERHVNVGRTMNGLAGVLQERGDLAAAESFLARSLAIHREALGPDHPGVASTLALTAKLHLARGEAAAAEAPAREALAIFRQRLGPTHSHVALVEQVLGTCLVRLGRFAEAEPLLAGSYQRIAASRGAEAPATREAAARVAELYETWGRPPP